MGHLVRGEWRDGWYDTHSPVGQVARTDSQFRNWVTEDGSPGPTGRGGFRAEAGRYHLYASLACPGSHPALLYRKLKGLEEVISVSITHWRMLDQGWTFEDGPGVIPDPVNEACYLHEIYRIAAPDYTGPVVVPVLWDRETSTIVSNESGDLIRMMNSAFAHEGATPGDYYPRDLQREIDALNSRIGARVSTGVYRAGFATSQAAYDEAVMPLFATLDELDERLSAERYLCGNRLTEADWRLFATLVRFDPVYHGHFRCNLRRIADYFYLATYLRDLYQTPGVAETVNFEHIKGHYYESHRHINPTGIVPVGPAQDLGLPHHRAALAQALEIL